MQQWNIIEAICSSSEIWWGEIWAIKAMLKKLIILQVTSKQQTINAVHVRNAIFDDSSVGSSNGRFTIRNSTESTADDTNLEI